MIKLPTIDEDDDENTPSPQVSVVDKPNLMEDWLNVLLLILLYIMQGLIHGFSLALPIILQSKKMVTYGDQALFSVVQWPYSMKLLWAPMADALYLRCFGRRKSWLLPLQYLMSVLLIYFAYNIDDWLPESGKPNLKMIIYVLLATNLLTAAQDVVVDGWALTMLKKNNVGYASSCNFSGVYIGMFIGNVCPILFSSEEFCNKYLRSTPGSGGIISIKNFLYFWSIMFLLVTTLVGIFKKENDHRLEDGYVNINVFQSYKLLWNIFKIQHMKTFLVIVLTSTIGITLTDSSTNFKLIDAGLSKDDIMMITSSTFILKIGLPLVASKYAAGLKPISFYLKWMPTRILWSFTSYPLLLFFTPYLIKSNGILNVPTYYYFIVGIIFAIQEILNNISTTAMIAFFAQISDPRFGSTYMTLFNTVRSVGFLISNMLLLEMVDILTFNKCSSDIKNDCPVPNVKDTCNKNVENCGIYVDGYYVEAVICLVIGLTWYSVFKSHLKNLESKSYSHWLVDLN